MSHCAKTHTLCIYWLLKIFAEPFGSIVGLRPPNPRKPTACGHPASPADGVGAYKPLGGYAAEMGIRELEAVGSTGSKYGANVRKMANLSRL